MNTRDVLIRAASNQERSTKAEVYMDSGVENLNARVDELFAGGGRPSGLEAMPSSGRGRRLPVAVRAPAQDFAVDAHRTAVLIAK